MSVKYAKSHSFLGSELAANLSVELPVVTYVNKHGTLEREIVCFLMCATHLHI